MTDLDFQLKSLEALKELAKNANTQSNNTTEQYQLKK